MFFFRTIDLTSMAKKRITAPKKNQTKVVIPKTKQGSKVNKGHTVHPLRVPKTTKKK